MSVELVEEAKREELEAEHRGESTAAATTTDTAGIDKAIAEADAGRHVDDEVLAEEGYIRDENGNLHDAKGRFTNPNAGEFGSADAAGKEEAKAEATPADELKFSDELLARAEARKISRDEAIAFGSPEQLEQAIQIYDRNFVASKLNDEAGTSAEATKAEVDKPTEEQSTAARKEAIEKLGLPQLDPEYYGEDVIKWQDKCNEIILDLKSQVETLASEREAARQAAEVEEGKQFVSWLDGELSKLDPELKSVFGDDKTVDLDKNSAEFAARRKAVAAMNALAEIEPSAKPEEILKSAIAALHPNLVQKSILNKTARDIRDQSKRRMGTGAAKAGPPVAADKKAPGYNPLKDPELIDAFNKMRAEDGND